MKKLRTFKFSTLIFYIIAAIVFNFSYDTPDTLHTKRFTKLGYQDNLQINDYESYYEFFSEFIFGLDDHVEEQQEAEQEQNLVKLKFYIIPFTTIKLFYTLMFLSDLTDFNIKKLPQGKFPSIFLPPELS
ncbi:hypothetical protein PBAC_25950 [Pedobacter glucosidilyticus]|uniref:Uncharacterized protein n=1 Tax=Pedobacter aquae TaxID=2605747 RepID=A0A5C0VEP0_9SPHI|nr:MULTISPECIES: hypothetical protein [Pedobacter]KHJ37265.1 hypothetical protein PBAC_25950 [Pedobacter glucosidilyticus]QEK50303.1 hypothetical protein FYC62_00455 [Pedobacter aquae]